MNLFQSSGRCCNDPSCRFQLHSGAVSGWKIECDAVTDDEWDTLALMLSEVLPPFWSVVGVPRGGIPLADALYKYRSDGSVPVLIVDDVLTTGASMEAMRQRLHPHPTIGAVIFARGACPSWVTALFQMPTPREGVK